jgi:hypothetical protein
MNIPYSATSPSNPLATLNGTLGSSCAGSCLLFSLGCLGNERVFVNAERRAVNGYLAKHELTDIRNIC